MLGEGHLLNNRQKARWKQQGHPFSAPSNGDSLKKSISSWFFVFENGSGWLNIENEQEVDSGSDNHYFKLLHSLLLWPALVCRKMVIGNHRIIAWPAFHNLVSVHLFDPLRSRLAWISFTELGGKSWTSWVDVTFKDLILPGLSMISVFLGVFIPLSATMPLFVRFSCNQRTEAKVSNLHLWGLNDNVLLRRPKLLGELKLFD